MLNVKKGQTVTIVITGYGTESREETTVAAVDKKRGVFSTDTSHVTKPSDIDMDGVSTYWLTDGRATMKYIPGFSSRVEAPASKEGA